jgi:predicted GIY-YIG superfamily endonuclease
MVAARPIPTLIDALKHYRTEQAYLRAVPPCAVFSNKMLLSIVSKRPTTLESLLGMRGIGPTRGERYGKDIVRLVNLDSRRAKRIKSNPVPVQPARKKQSKGKRTAKGRVGILKEKAIPKKALKAKKPVKRSRIASKRAASDDSEAQAQIVTSRFFPQLEVEIPTSIVPLNKSPTKIIPPRLPPSPKASVYILELEDGRVYVGSSRDVPRRIVQHSVGSGSAYTRTYQPTGVQLPRLGNVEGDGDAAERDETLRYMMLRGIPYVRGWKFCRVDMTPEEFDEAESNIRELFDLCRKCGYKGHFCTHCKATFDRLGNPVKGV